MLSWTERDNMMRKYTADDDGNVTVESIQDVEPILKYAEKKRAENAKTGEFHHYASIPLVVIEQWLKMGIDYRDQNDLPKIQRLIDTEYQYLKTTNLKGF
jgi:hypothetical protein